MIKKIFFISLLGLTGVFTSYASHLSFVHPDLRRDFLYHCGKFLNREDLIMAVNPDYSILNDTALLTLCDNSMNEGVRALNITKKTSTNMKKCRTIMTNKYSFLFSHILLKAMCVFLCDESKEFFAYNALEKKS